MSGFVLPGAVQAANTGLNADTESVWDGTAYTEYYVGSSGWHDSAVSIDSDLDHGVIGGYNNDFLGMSVVQDNSVTVNGGTVSGNVYGGYALTYFDHNMPAGQALIDADASYNKVTVSGGIVNSVYGGYAAADAQDIPNSIENIHISAYKNNVEVSGETVSGNVYGGYAAADVQGISNNIENIDNIADLNSVTVNKGTVSGNVYGGYVAADVQDIPNSIENIHISAYKNNVEVSGGTVSDNVYGGYISTHFGYNMPTGQSHINTDASYNKVTVSGGIVNNVYGGYVAANVPDIPVGMENIHVSAYENSVTVNGGTVSGNIYGGYVDSDFKFLPAEVYYNTVTVSDGKVSGNIYGGYAVDGHARVSDNTVILSGTADVSEASLYGRNSEAYGTDNNLVIDGWQGTVNSVNNFDRIDFQNLNWKNQETVLAVGDASGSSLADTDIHLISMAGGQDIHAGEYMYIIKSDGTLNTNPDKITVEENFTAGVAIDGTGEVSRDDQGNIKFEVTGTSVSDQINLVAENRAVAAAFVNQGTDLISDGLDAMNRDGNYGIKTFAAVHGNRSQYDVNSDLKINGWSTLVGIGNEKKIGSGDFSWGIFYENGSGNYRTYNKFNNEFFRGDGSLLYNGGGIAARLDREDGLYIEGSLRAGTLKSDMSNALKDGAGNSYGYESESTYYGAHIGAGKIFSVNETTDVDVYGKFFHTYTEGDSFAVEGDVFEFDKVTSNRLRIGSRVTTNKEDRLSLYYGLAWEYEFSGDAHMKAQGMSVPEQSLQGSSYMAEVGMHYKPGTASPWRFDLNVRGYAGQREGISFSAQAGYTF
mgnify:CR=1 FL=1